MSSGTGIPSGSLDAYGGRSRRAISSLADTSREATRAAIAAPPRTVSIPVARGGVHGAHQLGRGPVDGSAELLQLRRAVQEFRLVQMDQIPQSRGGGHGHGQPGAPGRVGEAAIGQVIQSVRDPAHGQPQALGEGGTCSPTR
ncbi:hypothetical protein ACUN3E_01670 [Streptomyces sp. Ju416(a)]|uniref:hypothetical protein n=1 Tax=Streptomyces sp. Ju416(a) TaxID=3446591 RepID=UPI00403D5F67